MGAFEGRKLIAVGGSSGMGRQGAPLQADGECFPLTGHSCQASKAWLDQGGRVDNKAHNASGDHGMIAGLDWTLSPDRSARGGL
jgi:hypothetical protein